MTENILITIDANKDAFSQKVRGALGEVLKLQGAERARHVEQLGIIEKMKLQQQVLKTIIDKSTNIEDIKKYNAELGKVSSEMANIKKLTTETNKAQGDFARGILGKYQRMGEVERENFKANLGYIQKLKLQEAQLNYERERTNDPKKINSYSKSLARVRGELFNIEKLSNDFRHNVGNYPIGTSVLGSILGVAGGMATFEAAKYALGAIKQLTVASLKLQTQNENTLKTFQRMVGKDAGRELLQRTIELGERTPFTSQEVQSNVQKFMTSGISADDSFKYIQVLGDLSSGESEKFNRLAYAFSQVKTAGKLMGTELRQLNEVGVNALSMLAQHTGKSTKQIQADITDGKVSFEMLAEAMEAATKEGGMFFNAMAEQSKTTMGMFSTLKDNVEQVGVAYGTRLAPVAKEFIGLGIELSKVLKDWVAIPLSEELETERTQLNGLVQSLIVVNGDYEQTAAVKQQIIKQFPTFLSGIDMEALSTQKLQERLEIVNNLYIQRVKSQKAKEEADKAANNTASISLKLDEKRTAALVSANKILEAQGRKPIALRDLEGKTDQQIGRFLAESVKSTGIGGDITKFGSGVDFKIAEYIYYANSLNKSKVQLAKANEVFGRTAKEANDVQMQVNKITLESTEEGIKRDRAKISELKKLNTAAGNAEVLLLERQISDNEKQIEPLRKESTKLQYDAQKMRISEVDREINLYKSSIELSKSQKVGGTDVQRSEFREKASQKLIELNKQREQLLQNLPKMQSDDESLANALSGGTGGKGTGGTSEGSAKEKKESAAKKLSEARKKESEQVIKDISQINTDIGKLNEEATKDTIDGILERNEREIEAERKAVTERITAYSSELQELGVAKSKAEKEALELYAKEFDALNAKKAAMISSDIKDFKKRIADATRDIKEIITNAQLELSKGQISLIKDDYEREVADIEFELKKDIDAADAKYNSIIKQIDEQLSKIEGTNDSSLSELKEKLKLYRTEVVAAKAEADLLTKKQSNQKVLEANDRALEQLTRQIESDAKSEALGQTDKYYIREQKRLQEHLQEKKISYAKYLKEVEKLEKERTEEERLNLNARLMQEKLTLQKYVETTEQGGVNEFVLTDEGYRKAVDRIKEIDNEIGKSDISAKDTKLKGSKDELTEYLDAYKSVSDQIINSLQDVYNKEVEIWDKRIALQSDRIEKAKKIRDAGNESVILDEEARMARYEEKRRQAVNRQQTIERISQISSVLTAVAKAFASDEGGIAGTAAKITSIIAALSTIAGSISSVLPAPQYLYKGIDSVGFGGSDRRHNIGKAKGVDVVPAYLQPNERVMTVKENELWTPLINYTRKKGINPMSLLPNTVRMIPNEYVSAANRSTAQQGQPIAQSVSNYTMDTKPMQDQQARTNAYLAQIMRNTKPQNIEREYVRKYK